MTSEKKKSWMKVWRSSVSMNYCRRKKVDLARQRELCLFSTISKVQRDFNMHPTMNHFLMHNLLSFTVALIIYSGYATNVASMSAGLPLVMPGPKATTFFCTICNREFSNVYYKRHMIVHANSRPYVCDVCGKRFNERSNMMKHKQRLHGPWDEKWKIWTKFVCGFFYIWQYFWIFYKPENQKNCRRAFSF